MYIMPRKARGVQPAGTFYHVMVRGNWGASIFSQHEDAQLFQDLLLESLSKTTARIHLPCLMPNHGHFLMEAGEEGLSAVMAPAMAKFAQRYNWRRNLRGHVFQDRFKSKVCADDRYLFALIRYIALNPVSAGLVELPADWKYSGYRAYFGYPNPLVTTEFVLSLFGGSLEGLRNFVEGPEDTTLPTIEDWSEKSIPAPPHLPVVRDGIKLETLLEQAADRRGIPIGALLSPGQRGLVAECRREVMWEARRRGFGLEEIGQALGISPNIVWRHTKGEKRVKGDCPQP
jgi:putative transposase